jgi:hypothetical protein
MAVVQQLSSVNSAVYNECHIKSIVVPFMLVKSVRRV